MHKQNSTDNYLWLSVIIMLMSIELDKILECHRTTAVSCTSDMEQFMSVNTIECDVNIVTTPRGAETTTFFLPTKSLIKQKKTEQENMCVAASNSLRKGNRMNSLSRSQMSESKEFSR